MINTSFKFIIIALLLFTESVNAQLTGLVAKNEKAIFQILSYDEYGVCKASGTGFFIDSNGTAISALHVLSNSKLTYIKKIDGTIQTIKKVTGVCEDCDMIEFKTDQIPPYKYFIPPAKSLPLKGSPLFTIGDPEGYSHTVTTGILSAIRNEDGLKTIQTTAPISHGSSGSPLMNMRGEVIGVVSYSDSRGDGLNFAYAIDCTKQMDRKNLFDISKYKGKDIRFINKISADEPFLILHSIEFTDTLTVLNFSYSNMSIAFGDGAYIYSITQDTTKSMYINDNESGKKYYMISSTIGKSPDDPTIMDLGETVFFKMNFPRISNLKRFDVGEGMSGGNWRFKDIVIPEQKEIKLNSIEKFNDEKHEELFSHLHNEYYEQAQDELKKIDKKAKDDFRSRVAAAVTEYSLNNLEAATLHLRSALEKNPNNEGVYADLFKLYIEQDKPELALKEINHAIELNGEYVEYFYMRAQVLFSMEKWEEAIHDLNKYLASDQKEDSDAYYYRAMSKIKLKEDTACSDLEKAKSLTESKKQLDKINIEISKICHN